MEAVMKTKLLCSDMKALLMVFIGLLLLNASPSNAKESGNFKTLMPEDVHQVGIINPDGAKSVWLLPHTDGDDIVGLLVKYSFKMIDGIKFYEITSWRDTAAFLTSVNEQQGRMILNLERNMRQLYKRVAILEKRGGGRFKSPLDHRVQALEKKVDEMTDSGHR
jgi:hypothetical protein